MRKTLLALTLALGLPLALGAGVSYNIIVNGQVARGKALVVSGETYVPLSALKLLGVTSSLRGSSLTLAVGGGAAASAALGSTTTAAGGANQLAALEGCMGQTLFNGVWRFKVTSFTPTKIDGVAGWSLAIEMKNATKAPLNPYGTGMSNTGGGYSLLPPSGNSNVWQEPEIVNDFVELNVPQGGLITYKFKFTPTESASPDDLAVKPTKFLLRIDTKDIDKKEVPYSVADPSFRVRLDCQK